MHEDRFIKIIFTLFIKLNWKYFCLIYNSKDTFLFEALDAYKSISIEKKTLIKLTTR